MSSNTYLQNALKRETTTDEKDIERELSTFLTACRDQFGYLAAFVVSEKTHRYYTPTGIGKVVNPQDDPYDIWYQLFLDSGKQIDLDVDRDQLQDYRWTIFSNMRLEDEQGNLLGVCGVGVFMDSLQEVIKSCEILYGLKINLIDKDGLISVDTSPNNIENAYIPEAVSDNATADEFIYTERTSGAFRYTRRLQAQDWYLVIQNFEHKKSAALAVCMIVLMYVVLAGLLVLSLVHRKPVSGHNIVKTVLPEDPLTGLPNRNYLQTSFGELGVFNTTRYKSLAMFDIDRFKIINETRDGDAILVGIVELAVETFGEKAMLFRWAGDEFVAFLEISAEDAETSFKDFCDSVKHQLNVTVSVGIVTINLAQSIKTNYHRAVQLCYAVKEKGGNGVARNTI